MRTALWSIVVGGIIGALLWTGPVGAQQPPGGLPGCLAQLGKCTTSLGKCQTDLAECQAEPSVVFPGDGVTGPALSYHNNGDGTITDNNTLLMWEVKDAGSGIHGVHRTFTWSSSGSAPDGTVFAFFLDTLNNKCDGDETTACTSNGNCTGIGNGLCGHAGHRDWRMPNVKELQSIVDYNQSFGAAIDPAFDPSPSDRFSIATFYWSFTTLAPHPENAWKVTFFDGKVDYGLKSDTLHVRAVRGGR